jgi:hypothetical protein
MGNIQRILNLVLDEDGQLVAPAVFTYGLEASGRHGVDFRRRNILKTLLRREPRPSSLD